jgi:hypothetical protein
MRKKFALTSGVSLFIAAILLLSCNGTNPPPSKTDSADSSKGTAQQTILPRYSLKGYLDTLWISTDSFMVITKKVTFRFFIKDVDTLTLRGWSGDNHIYNPNPDVILYNGRTSTIAQFGPGDYLGNLQLKLPDIKKIQQLIGSVKPVSKYVLFAPDLSANTGGQINYNIYLTPDNPQPLVVIPTPQTTSTGVTTNPSPPRNGN